MSSFTYMTSRAETLNVQTTSDFGNAEIRSQETFGLPLGAKFRIPEIKDLKVRWQEMPNARIDSKTGKKMKTPYLILKIEGSKPDDENSGIRFYPSTLVKQAFEANEDGDLTGNIIKAKGTATEVFSKYHLIQDGIRALAGKLLEVTYLDKVRVNRFGSKETRFSYIPTIDIVEEDGSKENKPARSRSRSRN